MVTAKEVAKVLSDVKAKYFNREYGGRMKKTLLVNELRAGNVPDGYDLNDLYNFATDQKADLIPSATNRSNNPGKKRKLTEEEKKRLKERLQKGKARVRKNRRDRLKDISSSGYYTGKDYRNNLGGEGKAGIVYASNSGVPRAWDSEHFRLRMKKLHENGGARDVARYFDSYLRSVKVLGGSGRPRTRVGSKDMWIYLYRAVVVGRDKDTFSLNDLKKIDSLQGYIYKESKDPIKPTLYDEIFHGSRIARGMKPKKTDREVIKAWNYAVLQQTYKKKDISKKMGKNPSDQAKIERGGKLGARAKVISAEAKSLTKPLKVRMVGNVEEIDDKHYFNVKIITKKHGTGEITKVKSKKEVDKNKEKKTEEEKQEEKTEEEKQDPDAVAFL